jgi:hypothetical protein
MHIEALLIHFVRFLLARLHMDSLLKPFPTTLADAKARLNALPERIHDIYDGVMERIEAQGPAWAALARKLLQWVFYAFEPLTLTQIRYALAIEPGNTTLDEEDVPDKAFLVSVCAEMITIQPGSEIVSLNHYTTREYLSSKENEIFLNAELGITRICLTYLLSPPFETPAPHDEDMNNRLQQYSLLQYAALHWGDHASGCCAADFADLGLRFLGQSSLISSSIQAMQISDTRHYEGCSQDFDKDVSGLWLAAYFGLKDIAGVLLQNGADMEQRTSNGDTALHVAVRNGHKTTVQLLLENEADVNAMCITERSTRLDKRLETVEAVFEQVRRGHKGAFDIYTRHLLGSDEDGLEILAQQLREMGCNITETSPGHTALHMAAEYGEHEIAELLLDYGADIDAQGKNSVTPLQLASREGHEQVVRLLLERGADVNAQGGDRGTALHMASQEGHSHVVRLLVGKAADTSI